MSELRMCRFHFNTTRISLYVAKLRIDIASSFRNYCDIFVCNYSPNVFAASVSSQFVQAHIYIFF